MTTHPPMTLRITAPAPVPLSDPAEAGPDDAARRGRLVIGDRVVEKVATHAVHQVPATIGAARRILGVAMGEVTYASRARVTARVEGDTATVSVALGVHWPASVVAVARQVRSQVREDVRRITAIDVRRIDIEVVGMVDPRYQGARVR